MRWGKATGKEFKGVVKSESWLQAETIMANAIKSRLMANVNADTSASAYVCRLQRDQELTVDTWNNEGDWSTFELPT